MIESFAQLFEESLKKIKIRPGSIIQGMVMSISKEIVVVDAGLKSESSIPIEQFYNDQGELEISVGDYVDVALDAIEDGFGETVLSREKAKRHESWLLLQTAYKEVGTVKGTINGKVKGGFTVELKGVRAFLPGSLVDIKPIKDVTNLEGQIFDFKIIKIDHKRNNVVVSRRAAIESENNNERNQLLKQLQEGALITGIVKNLTDYGAFIDLGGIDGLLHITDMAWKRVRHPSDIVSMGDEVTVKVLKFDKERTRVSLGLKQLEDDPWLSIVENYKEGDKLIGKVTNLTDYGCFIEITGGVEGLVHISEMDWTNKNIHPSKVVSIGESIEVMVLDIDKERRRISLGLKQCQINPWQDFSEKYNRGDQVVGKIKSITDFGIFLGLEGGIDGLVHLSDVSWNLCDEKIINNKYKKGDEITAIVLQVDPERERISLSIKQLTEDPFNSFLSLHKKGGLVEGRIISIDDDFKGITVSLSPEEKDKDKDIVYGYLRFSDSFYEYNKQVSTLFAIGDSITAKIDGIDRKHRLVHLSECCKNQLNKKQEVNLSVGNNNQQKQNKIDFSSVMIEAFKAATKNDNH